METHEFGTVLCLFSISRAGFSSVARKPLRSVRVQFAMQASHVSRAIRYLFQASWLSVETFCPLMRIGFLYYNCLNLISRLTTPTLYRILYRQY